MLLVALAYVLAGKFGLMLAYQYPSASPVWPATGIAVAALLLFGLRYWPAIFVGAFIVNITTAGSAATSVGIAVGNTLEGLVAALLIQRFTSGQRAFQAINTVILFGLFVCVASVLSATVGTAALALGGFAPKNGLTPMWITWCLGDAVGGLTIAPFILLWSRDTSFRWSALQSLEIFLLLVSLGFLGLIFFSDVVIGGSFHYPLAFFSLLPVLWVSIRFGPRETITVIVLLACIAIVGTLRGSGPFAVGHTNVSLVLLESFIAVIAVTGLTLAAALRERRDMEESLEQSVMERTQELRMSQEKDRANFERLRATILHLPMAALLMDESGNILELNEAYCRTFHIDIPPDQAKAAPQELLIRFKAMLMDPEAHMQKVDKTLSLKQSQFGEEIFLKDNRIILRDFILIVEAGTHRGHLFLYRDVTKERRTDRAKSEFMSLASHQLRTPLTAVRWSLNRLGKELGERLTEMQREMLHEGQRAAARMSETINTMLSISRLEAENAEAHMAECNICDIFREKESMFRSQYEPKKLAFFIECPDPLIMHTDAKCLREILANLLQNAIKYTPESGKIYLRAKSENGAIAIEVEDTGYGIPAHQQKNVFQKFFRGDNVVNKDTTGTGLGLYLVSLMTGVLRGSITMRSEEGKGTIFVIKLPKEGLQKGVA